MQDQRRELFSKKYFTDNNVPAYFLDCIFIITIGIVAILEVLSFIHPPFQVNASTDIIVSLIPTVITIITVAIQIQNEPIRGVPLRKFERLRKGFYFNLLHMSLIIVSVFAYETVFLISHLRASVLLLDLICIVYSCIFLIQEIPILLKNDHSINRVLKRIVVDSIFLEQEKNKDGIEVITNTLLTFGVEETFKMLNSESINDKDLLSRLLYLEDSYFSKVLESTLHGDKKETIKLYGLDIIAAINVAFSDIEYLLIKDHKLNAGLLSDDRGNEVFTFIRLTYLLKRVMYKLGYQERFKIAIDDLVNTLDIYLYSKKIKDNEETYRYLLGMILFNIKNGELWFLEAYRDKNFTPLFFDIQDHPLALFVSMYMCFYLNSRYGDEGFKTQLRNFLVSESKGLNSEGFTWKKKLKDSFEHNLSGKKFLNGIHEYLKIKQLLSDVNYEVRPPKGGVYSVDDSTCFSDELFFEYCIQILLFSFYFDIDKDSFEHFMEGLSAEEKTAFKAQFQTKWANRQNNEPSTHFYNFIYNEKPNRNLENNMVFEIVQKYLNEIIQKNYEKDENFKCDKDKLQDIKNTIKKELPKICKEMSFYNSKLNVDNEKMYCVSFYMDISDYNELLRLNIKNLKSTFNNIVRRKLESSVPIIEIEDTYFDSEIIKTILDNKSKYSGYCWRFGYNIDEMTRSKIQTIKQIDDGVLPRDMFVQEGGLKVKFKFIQNKTVVRHLRTDEINYIIEHEYTMLNGLYRYSKYNGSEVDVFYVTRDQLSKYIFDRRIFISIAFKYLVDYNKDKILYFVEKRSD